MNKYTQEQIKNELSEFCTSEFVEKFAALEQQDVDGLRTALRLLLPQEVELPKTEDSNYPREEARQLLCRALDWIAYGN